MLRISPCAEIGCVLLMVLSTVLALIGTGSVDDSVLKELMWLEAGADAGNSISRMAVAPSAGTVLLRTHPYRLEQWNLVSRQIDDFPEMETTGVSAVAQSDDARVVAAGYADGSVFLRPRSGSATRLRTRHTRRIDDLRISADSRFAVSTSNDGLVQVWNVEECRVVHRLRLSVRSGNGAVVAAFSPDGELIAAAARDGAVGCWSMSDGRLAMRTNLPAGAGSLGFSRHSKHLFITSTHASSVHCIDATSGQERWTYRDSRAMGPYGCVSSSPDGTVVAAGNVNGEINLFRSASGELIERVSAHKGFVSCLQYSGDGRLLFSASYDGTLAIWETTDFTEARLRLWAEGPRLL